MSILDPILYRDETSSLSHVNDFTVSHSCVVAFQIVIHYWCSFSEFVGKFVGDF